MPSDQWAVLLREKRKPHERTTESLFGPFADYEAAMAYAIKLDPVHSWVRRLEAPAVSK